MFDVVEWVETAPWTSNAATERPVEDHATSLLAKRRKQVRKQGKHLREVSAQKRHKLRIRAKKLRYMTEFFAGVFPDDTNTKRREAALRSLKQLQDALGDLNDIAVRKKALDSKRDSLSAHAAAMLDAEEKKTDKLLGQAQAAHAHFSAVKAFWKG